MSYLTRPSNVRVYQFRQPPLLRRRILPVQRYEGQRTGAENSGGESR